MKQRFITILIQLKEFSKLWCRRWDSVTKLPRHKLLEVVSRPPFESSVRHAGVVLLIEHSVIKNTDLKVDVFNYMCRREDSNLHTLRYTILSRARLPFRHSGLYFIYFLLIYTLHKYWTFARNGTIHLPSSADYGSLRHSSLLEPLRQVERLYTIYTLYENT
jgi:hypothetical protein